MIALRYVLFQVWFRHRGCVDANAERLNPDEIETLRLVPRGPMSAARARTTETAHEGRITDRCAENVN
jgi:hypothetical protein